MEKKTKKFIRIAIIPLIVSALIITFLPSTNSLFAIYFVPKIINNEQCQKIPEKTLEYFELQLDKWIKDSKKDREK